MGHDADAKVQNKLPSIEKIALEFIKEQRRARRWRIFFRCMFLVIFLLIILLLLPDRTAANYNAREDHVATIDIKGSVFASSGASAKQINAALDNAFENKHTIAVLLNINSPGGSPVQASDVYTNIMYLRQHHPKIKVYAVCSDICASGAYYIAAAANKIYANPSSLVGSIGVLIDGFGFVGSLEKLGIQRRVFTAGQQKDFLDPFLPLKTQDIAHAKSILNTVHTQFINDVKKGRGSHLQNNPQIFSGEIWTGKTALQLGLIDGFGDEESVSRDIIKNENLVDYTIKPGFLQFFSSGGIGAEAIQHLLASRLNTHLAVLTTSQ